VEKPWLKIADNDVVDVEQEPAIGASRHLATNSHSVISDWPKVT
jgi:hypothetical protein